MLTIIAFINFILTVFNTILCIYTFCIVDELDIKPEKINELSDILLYYFPLEATILFFIFSTALYYGNILQIIIIVPLICYNLYL